MKEENVPVTDALSTLAALGPALEAHPERLRLAPEAPTSRQELHDALLALGARPLWVHTSGTHIVNASWLVRELRKAPSVVVLEHPRHLDAHELEGLLADLDEARDAGHPTTLLTLVSPTGTSRTFRD